MRAWPQLRRQARDLRDQGLSIRLIANRLGLGVGTVGTWLAGYGEAFWDLRCENPECGADMVAFHPTRRFCGERCRKRAKQLEHEGAA